MGGSNSSTYYRWNAKAVTMEQKRIDIRWMKQQGYLQPDYIGTLSWSSGGKPSGSIGFKIEKDTMVLKYKHRSRSEDWEEVEQRITLDKTPCYFGGYRQWFICPRCHKRIAILYGAGKYFFCRHCHNLTYQSCNEPDYQRMLNKAYKLKEKLGGEGYLNSLIPRKPKGMHQKTYDKIFSEIIRLEGDGETMAFKKYGWL